MAIIDEFEINIEVDGKIAQEFDDDEESEQLPHPRLVSKYVEAVPGARFGFRIVVSPQYHIAPNEGIAFYFSLDGKNIGGITYTANTHARVHTLANSINTPSCRGHLHFQESWVEKQWLKFNFAKLETRETTIEDMTTLNKRYEDLGTIRIVVDRIQLLGVKPETCEPGAIAEKELVPEKALKGRPLDVSTSLSMVTNRNAALVWNGAKIGTSLARFRFKYRTKAGLQALLIIPRSESPELIEEQSLEDLSVEELRELVRQQRGQGAVKVENVPKSLKRERANTASSPARQFKSSRTATGQTVYHLDSSEDEADMTKKNKTTATGRPDRNESEFIDLE